MNTKTHTDIKSDGWLTGLIEKLPDPAKPYVYLARLDRPIGVWLLLLPGLWAIMLAAGGLPAMNASDWRIVMLFVLGALVMRPAGCVINDIWDRQLDQKVERTRARPLASGELSLKEAGVFLAALLLIGFLILTRMNFITMLLGILTIPLIILYPLMKRWTWWPQAFLGLVFNFGALMGWSAITGILDVSALYLYAAGVLWTLGYDTIYAHQDKEDDALIGIKSTALKFGDQSKKWVTGFYVLSWLCLCLAVITAAPQSTALYFMIPAGAHLFWQLKTWQPDDPASSLLIFKSNRDFGFLVLLGIALSGI